MLRRILPTFLHACLALRQSKRPPPCPCTSPLQSRAAGKTRSLQTKLALRMRGGDIHVEVKCSEVNFPKCPKADSLSRPEPSVK